MISIFLFTESVGSSAPKYSGQSDLSRVKASVNNKGVLTCPAQGSPIPSFR